MPAPAWAKLPHQDKKDLVLAVFGLAEGDCEIDEGTKDAPKREIVLTALKEGAGNQKDRRFYERSCVESIEPLVYSRRKIFYDHLTEKDAPGSDKMSAWAATITQTWLTEGANGEMVRKVRMKCTPSKAGDDLWELAKDPITRKELALSIEGRGAGRVDTKGGEKYTCIEQITWLNAFKLVPYPGNATMGADTVEADAPPIPNSQEDDAMDIKTLTLSVLEAERPDLIEAISKKVAAKIAEGAKPKAEDVNAAVEAAVVKLREEFKTREADAAKAHSQVVATLQENLAKAEKRLDAAEVREKLADKETIIADVLGKAKLPAEAVTERFMTRLRSITEREIDEKGTKKVLSVREQIEGEVAEMKSLLTPKVGTEGKINESHAITPEVSASLTEADKSWLFEKQFCGLHPEETVAQYLERRKAENAAKK